MFASIVWVVKFCYIYFLWCWVHHFFDFVIAIAFFQSYFYSLSYFYLFLIVKFFLLSKPSTMNSLKHYFITFELNHLIQLVLLSLRNFLLSLLQNKHRFKLKNLRVSFFHCNSILWKKLHSFSQFFNTYKSFNLNPILMILLNLFII